MRAKFSSLNPLTELLHRTLSTIFLVVLCACWVPVSTQSAGLPEKLRILSIDLENVTVQPPGTPGSQLAEELQKLLEKADPDIVCLQGATDWEHCDTIAKLKRGFRVLTCSAFTAKTGAEAVPQVAILARDKAVLSWVEEISEGQGFAFGIFQTGTRKLGIFSLQAPKSASATTTATADRVLAEVRKLQQFPQNRPDAFLIATGGPIKTSPFGENALQTVNSDGPPGIMRDQSEFWAWNAAFLSRPRLVPVSGVRMPVLVCDLDAANSSPSKFAYQSTLLFAGESSASVQALLNPPAPAIPQKSFAALWPALVGAGLFLLALLFFFGRKTPKPGMELVPLNAPGELVVKGPDDPVRLNLLAWIKTRFVQRLLSDRQQMISTENEATQRTLVIEEKISRLQHALQSRISAYEARIERLEHELTAATFENRDLIRSQIELLKEKVAKAKEEHSFRRN